jgi:hypothetical protein
MPWIRADICKKDHSDRYLEGEEVEGGWRDRQREGHQHWLFFYTATPCCGAHGSQLLGILDPCQKDE